MPRDPLKINLFTAGDSGDIATWSNLPYFLSKALVEQGVELRRINLIPEQSRLFKTYRRAKWKVDGLSKRLRDKPRPMDLFRGRMARALVQRQIRKACKDHPGADFNFFLTFSYSSKDFESTPTVHFSDISLEHSLRDKGQSVSRRQRALIDQEKANLSRAAMVLTTNQPCRDYLSAHYGIDGARRLQCGINLGWKAPANMGAYLDTKWDARRVLFIGRGVHKRGVDILLEAFAQLNEGRERPYRLSLVGITPPEIGSIPEGVECLGYLNKNNPEDLKRYIGLLESATMFVMPLREGPPPGVTKEALLTGTPVIMSNIWNADVKLQHDRSGRLVDQIEPGAFAKEMAQLADNEARWRSMAKEAMAFAEQWTWAQPIGGLVDELYRLREGDQA